MLFVHSNGECQVYVTCMCQCCILCMYAIKLVRFITQAFFLEEEALFTFCVIAVGVGVATRQVMIVT